MDTVQLYAPVAALVVDASAQTTSQKILLIMGLVAGCALIAVLNIGVFWAAVHKGGRVLLFVPLTFVVLFGLVLLISLACGISINIALAISDGSSVLVTGVYLLGDSM
jgi:hypothetical protein